MLEHALHAVLVCATRGAPSWSGGAQRCPLEARRLHSSDMQASRTHTATSASTALVTQLTRWPVKILYLKGPGLEALWHRMDTVKTTAQDCAEQL